MKWKKRILFCMWWMQQDHTDSYLNYSSLRAAVIFIRNKIDLTHELPAIQI